MAVIAAPILDAGFVLTSGTGINLAPGGAQGVTAPRQSTRGPQDEVAPGLLASFLSVPSARPTDEPRRRSRSESLEQRG